ncbi:MAG: hypothetical protein HC896_05955 [Bacteroidales bacterium]|nr:hypothetical protein [Bacteroidales bacterium]
MAQVKQCFVLQGGALNGMFHRISKFEEEPLLFYVFIHAIEAAAKRQKASDIENIAKHMARTAEVKERNAELALLTKAYMMGLQKVCPCA